MTDARKTHTQGVASVKDLVGLDNVAAAVGDESEPGYGRPMQDAMRFFEAYTENEYGGEELPETGTEAYENLRHEVVSAARIMDVDQVEEAWGRTYGIDEVHPHSVDVYTKAISSTDGLRDLKEWVSETADRVGGGGGSGTSGTPGAGPDDGPGPDDGGGPGDTTDTGPGDGGAPDDGPSGSGPTDTGPSPYLDLSLEVASERDAAASSAEPFNPEYTLEIAAYAPDASPSAAKDYATQYLIDSSRIELSGAKKGESETDIGAYDLPDDWDAVQDIMDNEFAGTPGRTNRGRDGVYTMEVTDAEIGDWDITEAGRYRMRAYLDGRAARSNPFGVAAADGDVEGWNVSIATEPSEEDGEARFQAQDLSESSDFTEYVANTVGIGTSKIDSLFGTLNSTASPGFNIYIHNDGGSDVNAEEYLTDELDEIVVKWMETEHRFEGDAVPNSSHYDPSGTVQKMAVLDSYDRATGELMGEVYDGDTSGTPVDTVSVPVDVRSGDLIRLEEPLPYDIPDGGKWDVGAELHHGGEFAGREWGGFDIDRYSRTDALRDFAGAFTLLNHGGDMPDEEEEEQYGPQWGQKVQDAREKHGGVIGAIDRFFSLDANDVSDALAGDVLHGWLTGGN